MDRRSNTIIWYSEFLPIMSDLLWKLDLTGKSGERTSKICYTNLR